MPSKDKTKYFSIISGLLFSFLSTSAQFCRLFLSTHTKKPTLASFLPKLIASGPFFDKNKYFCMVSGLSPSFFRHSSLVVQVTFEHAH